MSEQVRYLSLGPVPKPKTEQAPADPKGKKKQPTYDKTKSVQESLSLPEIQETIGPSQKDIAYIISTLEEISSKIESIEEKLEKVINNNGSTAPRKEEEVNV